jgi:hypothetical protein
MSGPKGYGYQVLSAEELRRREDDAREGRCHQYAAELAGLAAQLGHYGADRPEPVATPKQATHEGLIAWESALRQAIGQAQDQVRDEAAKAIVRRLNASRPAVDVSQLSLGVRTPRAKTVDPATPQRPAPDSRKSDAVGTRDRVRADVSQVMDVVAGLRDPGAREQLTHMAEGVLTTASASQARADLLTLKTSVSQALRVQECRDLAAEAVLAIAAVDTPEADRLRQRAGAVLTMDDVTALGHAADAVRERADKEQDAHFVRETLGEVLAELGFTVAAGFERTDFGAVAVAEHADHPGYGVRFQVNADNGMLFTRVVARGGTTPEQDARAEEQTCAKVYAVADGLRARGVATQLRTERKPGETPVERRAASESRASVSASQTRKRTKPQERAA